MKRGTLPRTKSPRLPQKVPPAQKLITRPEGTSCAINDTCVSRCFRVLVDNNRNERNRERLQVLKLRFFSTGGATQPLPGP